MLTGVPDRRTVVLQVQQAIRVGVGRGVIAGLGVDIGGIGPGPSEPQLQGLAGNAPHDPAFRRLHGVQVDPVRDDSVIADRLAVLIGEFESKLVDKPPVDLDLPGAGG